MEKSDFYWGEIWFECDLQMILIKPDCKICKWNIESNKLLFGEIRFLLGRNLIWKWLKIILIKVVPIKFAQQIDRIIFCDGMNIVNTEGMYYYFNKGSYIVYLCAS